ncbi:M28 family peptidase [Nocardioides sp. CN2-186]|uniref:M28 family metallopeptidase n=1 Tax=Nocardioides tweenelious TaxID=3156607 RepID=UPI0032B34912
MRTALAVLGTGLALSITGCTDEPDPDVPPPPATPSTTPSTSPIPTPAPDPVLHFDQAVAMRTVRHLAGDIGPRLATGPSFREAAAYVDEQLARAGYETRRQSFPVPAGDSWGVPVAAGRSFNVIATPPGFDPASPYVLVGAHLDTVAVAPGAEDNASGVAVLLELARTLGATPLPVVLVAFGGEEPRGTGDDLHHFGSRFYVDEMTDAERSNLVAMVAMDRVGVGGRVPLSSVEGRSERVRDQLERTARHLDVPFRTETDAASDHESFADAGFDAARVGSTPYAGYHSAGDVPSVVRPDQLGRVGRVLTSWLRGR